MGIITPLNLRDFRAKRDNSGNISDGTYIISMNVVKY